ncbi:hypothetical protein RCL1_008045 [Eukaryota sp. TZLM3-RCL]
MRKSFAVTGRKDKLAVSLFQKLLELGFIEIDDSVAGKKCLASLPVSSTTNHRSILTKLDLVSSLNASGRSVSEFAKTAKKSLRRLNRCVRQKNQLKRSSTTHRLPGSGQPYDIDALMVRWVRQERSDLLPVTLNSLIKAEGSYICKSGGDGYFGLFRH